MSRASQVGESSVTAETRGHKFGTFGGVFTPSILTIFGIVMYLRAGFCVGQVGIVSALVILGIGELVTLLTALSICAISTNTPVRGGGMYYMISRSLGPEFGGAIGLALFFAQALSAPFYVIGFTEALVYTFPALRAWFLYISLGSAGVLFFITYIGADYAIKFQYLILAVLGLSIIALIGGTAVNFDAALLSRNLHLAPTEPRYSFWIIFAIYFPATTGITAGVSMSGDLQDPKRSLPLGTLLAVGLGTLVYAAQIVLMGGAFDQQTLVEKPYEILVRNALFGAGFLIVAGVFAASLSSAVGSFMGAPRVLQALARDEILRPIRPFAAGSKKRDEPRRALWFNFALTLIVLLWAGNNEGGGALNVVAGIVTMFFLYAYGITNLAAFVESRSANPSFRPKFRLYHWTVALAGAAACIATSFLIDKWAAVGAIVIIAALYAYIKKQLLTTAFGDSRRGYIYSRVRDNLLKLAEMPPHAKNWRPAILVLSRYAQSRPTMMTYANWLECNRGIVSLGRIVVADDFKNILELREGELRRLETWLRQAGLPAFPEVLVTADLDAGLNAMLQCHSIGPIKPNIVMFGWPSEPDRVQPFAAHLRAALEMRKSLVALIDHGLPPEHRKHRRIDVWWRGMANGSLMLILAYLIRGNMEWTGARIRVLRCVENEAGREPAAANLAELVQAARVEAAVKVVVSDAPFPDVLRRESADATTLILGFRVPDEHDAETFYQRFSQMAEGLPTTLLVCSSGEADLLA